MTKTLDKTRNVQKKLKLHKTTAASSSEETGRFQRLFAIRAQIHFRQTQSVSCGQCNFNGFHVTVRKYVFTEI
jgi:hypothetical protein